MWDYELGEGQRPVAQRRRSWAADAPQTTIDEAFHTIVTDLVGTPTELVAPDGSVDWHITTSLYGIPIVTSSGPGQAGHDVDCPLRFPGQFHDAETGLHYNVQRYYDPERGTYLSPDPLGLAPSPNDQGYVPNPTIGVDPLGLALMCVNALQPLKDRADYLHGLLPEGRSQNSYTVAVVRALDKQGKEVHVVGWSGPGAMRKIIRSEVGGSGSLTNEIMAAPLKGVTQYENHAERTALATIKENGWTPLGGAASRPVCPWCENSVVHTPFDTSRGIGTATLIGPHSQMGFAPPVPGATGGKSVVLVNQVLPGGKSGGWLQGQSMFTW